MIYEQHDNTIYFHKRIEDFAPNMSPNQYTQAMVFFSENSTTKKLIYDNADRIFCK
jgi:hypothetical protein